jgi:preprotein translocase subunit SecG
MIKVLLVLHVFVTIALIGVVLIQRSEGGGLGLGAGQGMGNFMTGRGTANLLTRTTAILGTAFFVLSLGLALLYKGGTTENAAAILNAPAPPTSSVPVPGAPVPGAPAPRGAAQHPQTPADALPPAVPAPAVPAPSVPAPPLPAAGSGSKTN